MKKIRLFLLTGLFLFGGCAVTHYDSLDQKPQTDILISSNVSAQIWINGQKIQENAKEHLLKQAGLDIVTLKADGYHEARVIVYRSLPEKKNVSSHQSSVSWTTRKGADISSDLSGSRRRDDQPDVNGNAAGQSGKVCRKHCRSAVQFYDGFQSVRILFGL